MKLALLALAVGSAAAFAPAQSGKVCSSFVPEGKNMVIWHSCQIKIFSPV
jgi:hypothetical protein